MPALGRRRLAAALVVLVPALVPAPAPAAPGYRVQPGDTLTAIAARFHTTVSALARANRLDPNGLLQAGVTLRLPGRRCPPVLYRVRAGDTLTAIAARYKVTVPALARANKLDANGLLLAGTRLKLPGTHRCPPSPPNAAAPGGAKPAATAPAAAQAVASAGASPAAKAAAPSALARSLARALAAPGISPGLVGAAAIDLRTGATVFARNADRPLEPASAEKLPLSLAVLSELGPGFRTDTEVLGSGVLQGTAWHGDLVLKGFGDPDLSSSGLVTLAGALRARGIASVTGRVLGDESFFDARRTAPGWKPSFYKAESPPLSALVVDRGELDGVVVDRPALAAAVLFTRALRSAGVAVAGKPALGRAGAGATRLADLPSQPLRAILQEMDRWSDNFIAEMLLKQLGARKLGRGTTAAGAAVVERVLHGLGVPLAGVRIVDGSGLSRDDRLTSRALAAILAVAHRTPSIGNLLAASLPVAGVSGTLRHRMLSGPAHGRVHAKTGTTDVASALAGYAGSRYAFALLMNGTAIPFSAAHAAQDRFAQLLAASAG